MDTNIKRDFKIVLAGCIAILAYGFCGDASAQTTQPVYTRPSKGSVLTVYSAAAPQASFATSVTFDWSAFSSADVVFTFATSSGGRCSCPSGVDNCIATFDFGVQQSTSKTGPFGITNRLPYVFPISYDPGSTGPFVGLFGQVNISAPYVQFFGKFTSYIDSGTGNPVAGCVLTATVTPIPFTDRVAAEGPFPGVVPSISQVKPLMSGGVDYVDTSGGSGTQYSTQVTRVNAQGVLAVGGGSGNPALPATTPIAVNAATLVYTATAAQRGVRLQNVGANPALCAAGDSAASVAAGRYSFALAAAATAGAGGTFDVQQLDTRNGSANGKVYCLGSGGATSIAILPY